MKKPVFFAVALIFSIILSASQWTYAEDTKAERFADDLSHWMDNMKVEITEEEKEALREVHHLLYKLAESQSFSKYYSKFFWEIVRQDETREIAWQKACELILQGEVVSVKQTHSLDVSLTCPDGQKYKTKEQTIDEVWHLIDEVDPKGIFIMFSTE